jgi:cell wall-associated NlpC family hydrolase
LTLAAPSPILRAMTSTSTRKSAWTVCISAGLLAFSSAAFSAPDEATDAVTRLLMEKGLMPSAGSVAAAPTESPLVRQVRDTASDMVITAMNFLGVPYKRGGNNQEDGFDCSGFTRHIFEMSLGLVLPRRADDQASAPGLLQIARDDLKPGDLVFFNTLKRTFSHVGIYIGEGKFIHSPRTGGAVRVEDMRFAYWNTRFTGARRVEAPTEADLQAAKAAAVAALATATSTSPHRPSAK